MIYSVLTSHALFVETKKGVLVFQQFGLLEVENLLRLLWYKIHLKEAVIIV